MPSTQVAAKNGDGNDDRVVNKRELQEENSGVTLAGILDLSNHEWAETVFQVTIDLLNDKNDGFFDADLAALGPIEYEIRDSACDPYEALSEYWNVRAVADGVIGARCSGASTPLAWLGGFDNIPQVSPMSTSAKLSNKSEFPYFSRVVSPDDQRGQVGALIQTMDLFGWDRVTIINTDTAYAKDLATSFLANWKGEVSYLATVKLDADGSVDEESVDQVVEGAPHDDPRINSKVVLVLAHDQHAHPILKRARDRFPEDTFYIGTDAWIGSASPSDDRLTREAGYLGVVPYSNKDEVHEQFVRLGGDRLRPYLNAAGEFQDHAADYTVDAIVAMALALAATPPGLRRDGAAVTAALRRLEFRGVTGPVSFTNLGDRRNPQFSILNFQRFPDGHKWVNVGTAGTGAGTATFGPSGIRGVCFAGVGCGLDAAPNDSPPPPVDRIETWVPVVISLLIIGFAGGFYLYRRKKIIASRKAKAIIAAKEGELNDFRNSVVDMCTAEEQYVPKITNDARMSMSKAAQARSARWCWRETEGFMGNWGHEEIEGNPSDRWVRYDDSSNQALELAYEEQGRVGQCTPIPGYVVDFSTMIQTKATTNFQREVKRVEVFASEETALDLSNIVVAKGRPSDIAKEEPHMVLVPGDIVQITKKRTDGWAYGSKLHLEDEPLCRRLVQLTLSSQDIELALSGSDASVNGGAVDGALASSVVTEDNDKILVAGDGGWFPMNVTRAPNTDDLATFRKTLGSASDLAPPENWDHVADPSVVQKSKALDEKSKEYQDVAVAFLATLPESQKIVRIQRIQNMAMWQSYIVKRKTVIDRDTSLRGSIASKGELARFERKWLWHGTNEDSVDKIIQQGFNRSFCGKNATAYGKGVYFARNASYSSCDTYSPKNSSGHKFILACSVVVGEFCNGKHNARTPDLRDAAKNILFDSTVDNLARPSLYVTYHDAQAYPEYLIVFK